MADPVKSLSTKVFSETAARFEEQFNRLIPSTIKRSQVLTGQRVVGLLVNLWSTSEDIRKCKPSSVLNAAGLACAVGLEFNNAFGHSAIIKYNNSRKVNGQWKKEAEAQWQPMYRGLVTLALRSEKVQKVASRVVMEDDKFEYEYGSNEFLRHIQAPRDQQFNIDSSPWTHAYCMVHMNDGSSSFYVMHPVEVLEIRDRASKGFAFDEEKEEGKEKKSPWSIYPEEMIRKTPAKRHLKWCDLTSHLSQAVGNDEIADAGEKQDVVIEWKDYSAEDIDNDPKLQVQGVGPGAKAADDIKNQKLDALDQSNRQQQTKEEPPKSEQSKSACVEYTRVEGIAVVNRYPDNPTNGDCVYIAKSDKGEIAPNQRPDQFNAAAPGWFPVEIEDEPEQPKPRDTGARPRTSTITREV